MNFDNPIRRLFTDLSSEKARICFVAEKTERRVSKGGLLF